MPTRGRPSKRRNVSSNKYRPGSGRGHNLTDNPIDVNSILDTSTFCQPIERVELDDISDNYYALIPQNDLRNLIVDNLCPKEYVSHGMSVMLNDFCTLVATNIDVIFKKIRAASDKNKKDYITCVNDVITSDLDVTTWKNSFIRRKNHPKKAVYKSLGDDYIHPVDVKFVTYGLATSIHVDARHNDHQCKSKKEVKNTYSMNAKQIKNRSGQHRKWSNYEINNLAVLANHACGMGAADFKKYFSFLQLQITNLHHLHSYVEDFVGATLIDVSERSMRKKLLEEVKMSTPFFNIVLNNPIKLTKIPIVIKLDMQWLQRGFLSPSGTIHAIGGLTNGIIGTKLLINKCTACDKLQASKKKLEPIINQCESKQNACVKCIDICLTKGKIIDVEKKIDSFQKICTKKFCPSDKSCECNKIRGVKSKITRATTKLTKQKLNEDQKVKLSSLITTEKNELARLDDLCVKTIHDKEKCKCSVIPRLKIEIERLKQHRAIGMKKCAEDYAKKTINYCHPANCCVSCNELKRFVQEKDYLSLQKKFDEHDCLSNWDGSARSMEGHGGTELIVELGNTEECFVRLLVKDDDATITAAFSPRFLTKEEERLEIFSPSVKAITNIGKIPDDTLPFICSDQFEGMRLGYVYKRTEEYGLGYHYDTFPANPEYAEHKVSPTCLERQNDKGKLSPDYEFMEIGALADPQHRCRNFGKDIVALAKAPLRESKITEETSTRIIKLFKYWYRQSSGKEFDEIKHLKELPILHATGDHSLCNEDWCYALQAARQGKRYAEPSTNLDPSVHQREIKQVLEILRRYTTDNRIREMMHKFDTQICEALNNALTFYAPKNKTFSRSHSLEYRKCHVIGIHNDGIDNFYKEVFTGIGIEMSVPLFESFENMQTTKNIRQVRQADFDNRRKRAHGFEAKLKSEVLKQRSEGTSYQSNMEINKIVNKGKRKK